MRADQTTETGRARVLAAVVALCAREPREPSVKVLAEATGLSRNYVGAALLHLERRLLVTRRHAGAVVRWRATP